METTFFLCQLLWKLKHPQLCHPWELRLWLCDILDWERPQKQAAEVMKHPVRVGLKLLLQNKLR